MAFLTQLKSVSDQSLQTSFLNSCLPFQEKKKCQMHLEKKSIGIECTIQVGFSKSHKTFSASSDASIAVQIVHWVSL